MDGFIAEMAEVYEGDCITRTLSKYKDLATDEANHPTLIKDKAMLQFLIYCLESNDPHSVELSLETIDFLAQNFHNRKELHMNEIVKTINEIQNFLPSDLKKMSEKIIQKIASPSMTKFKEKLRNYSSNIFKFHVFGLSNENREILEQTIVRVDGVISVVVNPNHQRIVVRAKEEISAEALAEAISQRTGLVAHLVVKNNENQEFLEDVLEGATQRICGDLKVTNDMKSGLPSYLPEEFFENETSLNPLFLRMISLKSSASKLMNSAMAFFLNLYSKWYLTHK